MFGRRPDGKKIKEIDGFYKMASLFLGDTRVDTTNYMFLDLPTRHMDEYIAQKKKEGVEYAYRDIILATLVRLFYICPVLNRFVYSGTFYQRNSVDISMAMHKNLKTGEQETAMKCHFTGKETIAETKAVWDAKIQQTIKGDNETDEFAGGFLGKLPTWMIRIIVRFIKFFDRHGMLTKKFINQASPFHCSVFFTDMKSIHMDVHLHHLYKFGNCGFFCVLGKEKFVPVVDEKTMEVRAERVVPLGFSIDERFIDGLYFSNVIKTNRRILENLSCLERVPEDDEIKPAKKAVKNVGKKA